MRRVYGKSIKEVRKRLTSKEWVIVDIKLIKTKEAKQRRKRFGVKMYLVTLRKRFRR